MQVRASFFRTGLVFLAAVCALVAALATSPAYAEEALGQDGAAAADAIAQGESAPDDALDASAPEEQSGKALDNEADAALNVGTDVPAEISAVADANEIADEAPDGVTVGDEIDEADAEADEQILAAEQPDDQEPAAELAEEGQNAAVADAQASTKTSEDQAAPQVDAVAEQQAKSTQGASGKWDATRLSMDAGDGQLGATVVLKPILTGDPYYLAFRYTIETNDGKDVTLLQRYQRGIPDFTFTLNRSGTVKIKLEIRDYKGNARLLQRTLVVDVPKWDMKGLSPDYKENGATAFVPQLSGDTRFLRYAYTWTAADGSSKSGKIARDGEQSADFKPDNGVYDIDLHVIGTDGKAKDAALSYVAGSTRATFSHTVSPDVVYRGKNVGVKASGTDEHGRALAFAYSLGSSSASGASAVLASPSTGGFYPLATKVLVDGKQIATRKDTISAWDLSGLSVGKSGRTINANALVAGIPKGWTYKFLYSGPNGSGSFYQGGSKSASTVATKGGTYTITVELYDASGKKMGSKSGKVNMTQTVAEKMLSRAQGYSSYTGWLILVNTADRNVGVYRGSRGNWQSSMFSNVSVGAAGTPTVKGEFTVGSKGYSFSGADYTCYHWTQFYGDYLFHSVLYHRGTKSILDGRLRKAISHGCVRMDINDAYWLQSHVPSGSKVVVY